MRKLGLGGLLALLATVPASGQQGADRALLEVGMVGGGNACPGHYAGIESLVAGPVSAYGVLETYRCDQVPKTSSRLGASARLGPADWWARPAARSGLSYSDEGDFFYTVGGSLTLGRRYGARFVVDGWRTNAGGALVLLHIAGYVSF